MTDKVSLRDALNEASRDAQAFRDARRNADEVVTLRAEIARLRAENDRLRAGRLREGTVAVVRERLSLAWCDSAWGSKQGKELSEALADLDRCYPPEEV